MPTSEPDRVPGRRAACFAVVDPATGEAFDEAPDQQPDELDAVVDRAEAVADRFECGTAWINHHAELSLAQPFAGGKNSGVAVAGGP